MTEGLVAAQARIAQIQSLIAPPRPASTSATSSTDFASALALASGEDGSTDGSSDLGDQAVSTAAKYIGTPYLWGGTDPSHGLDCSGLTQLVYKQLGVNLPRTSQEQAKVGTEVASLSQAKPGDLLFFGSPVHHVGIYAGDGKMIDAPHTGSRVKQEKVWATPSHIRRVLPDSSSGSSGGVSAASISALLGTSSTAASSSSSSMGTPYDGLFQAAGQRYGIDPALLAAVAKQESDYNPNAVSRAGAQGLMQLMPGTARELGVDPRNPAQAIDGAAKLLAQNLRSFNGRTDLALAAYNAGAGNVRKYGGIPPFTETRNYVQKVTQYWGQLR